VVQLIERADAVVMDLRGFNAQRVGCEFELAQLAARRRGEQVLLVVDGSTDRALLEARTAANTPGLRIVELQRGGATHTDAVFAALLDAAC
jgi:hypothetical protein